LFHPSAESVLYVLAFAAMYLCKN